MTIPQNGIFAQGTHAHYFLELDLNESVMSQRTIASFQRLRSPAVSAVGVNVVLAFGPDVWRAVAPQQALADLAPFREIRDAVGTPVPARQHDVWNGFFTSGQQGILLCAITHGLARDGARGQSNGVPSVTVECETCAERQVIAI